MSEMINQRAAARRIVETLQGKGHTALFAGGCVRDELLGREPKDYDVATDADPDEVENLFPKTVPIGKAFGVIAVIDGGVTVEVATFREEVGSIDGRHPESVKFSAAKEDALRRDFTINGMFYDPIKEELRDYVHGKQDLAKRIVTAIGNPVERFGEDHLRMLRAIRFAHILEFTLAPETEAAIKQMAHLISRISAERIEAELTRILTDSPKPGDALRHLHHVGLLQHILPDLIPMIGQEQPPQFHPEGDVFDHTCLMLNLMNQGQAGKPALPEAKPVEQAFQPAIPEAKPVEQAFLPALPEAKPVEQAFQPALPEAKPVEQAFQPALPEDELAQNPFRPVAPSPALHTSHRRLPHWEQDNRIYFVTFRLADSIANEKLLQWKAELEVWRLNQPAPESEETHSEQTRRYREKQQWWLDQGHGSCTLKDPELSALVEQTLRHFDGERYRLGDYVVMPNHVHLTVEPMEGNHLSDILHSWKGFSAREINKRLGTKGRFWMDESFDHIIRSEHFFHQYRDYIQTNPTQARLSTGQYRLGCGALHLSAPMEGQAGKPAPHVEQ
uniref:transposase n=1 Tax=Pontiella sp. TaxID=2837462 RepID=UPI003562908F